jgi:hypothetical protein
VFGVGHHLAQQLCDKSGSEAWCFRAVPKWHIPDCSQLRLIAFALPLEKELPGMGVPAHACLQATGRIWLLGSTRLRDRGPGGGADGQVAVADGVHTDW